MLTRLICHASIKYDLLQDVVNTNLEGHEEDVAR